MGRLNAGPIRISQRSSGPCCPDRIAVRSLFPIPKENFIMPYASVHGWGIRNTMKAGRRHGRSTRPSLEAMEGRTLLTAAPVIFANGASVVEHATGPVTMQFTIDLTTAATQPVTVNYQTSNSTAIAGTDYTAAAGTLTIAAGQTSGIIPVTVLADPAATANKVFYLSLSGASGATIATPKLSGLIVEHAAAEPVDCQRAGDGRDERGHDDDDLYREPQ